MAKAEVNIKFQGTEVFRLHLKLLKKLKEQRNKEIHRTWYHEDPATVIDEYDKELDSVFDKIKGKLNDKKNQGGDPG